MEPTFTKSDNLKLETKDIIADCVMMLHYIEQRALLSRLIPAEEVEIVRHKLATLLLSLLENEE